METRRHKSYSLQEAKIKRLKRLLQTDSDTEALRRAVDIVLSQPAAAKAWIENGGAGGVEDRNVH